MDMSQKDMVGYMFGYCIMAIRMETKAYVVKCTKAAAYTFT